MSEQVTQLNKMGFSGAAAVEVADRIAQISAAHVGASDAYDAIIEYLYLNFPHLPLTGNSLHVLVGRGTKPLAGERLKAYRVALHSKLVARMSHPGVPEEFMQRVGQLAVDMFQTAQDAAKSSYEEMRSGIEHEAAERVRRAERDAVIAKDAAQAAQESQAEAFEMARTADQRREAAVIECVQVQERLTQTLNVVAQCESSIAQLQAEIRTMREEGERQQTAFTQQLELERAERARERDMLDGQIRFANQQIDAARQQAVAVKTQLEAATRERASLESMHREFVAQLRGQIDGLTKDLAVARGEAGDAEARAEGLRSDNEALRVRVAELASLPEQVMQLKGELARRDELVQQLVSTQAKDKAKARDKDVEQEKADRSDPQGRSDAA